MQKILETQSQKFDYNFYSKMPFRVQRPFLSTLNILFQGIFETFDTVAQDKPRNNVIYLVDYTLVPKLNQSVMRPPLRQNQ